MYSFEAVHVKDAKLQIVKLQMQLPGPCRYICSVSVGYINLTYGTTLVVVEAVLKAVLTQSCGARLSMTSLDWGAPGYPWLNLATLGQAWPVLAIIGQANERGLNRPWLEITDGTGYPCDAGAIFQLVFAKVKA